MNITLRWDHKWQPGDKSVSVTSEQNDGWCDLRIEVDTDDCDREYACKAMQYVIDTVNAAAGKARK